MAGSGGLIAACSSDDDATSGPTGPLPTNLRVADITSQADSIVIDPATFGANEFAVMDGIFEGLTAYKPGTNEIVNLLAEYVEPSADGLRIAFGLKQGIEFHEGYGEVTAEDVKFSFERMIGKQPLFPGATGDAAEAVAIWGGDWAALEEVRVTGKYTGEIVLKDPNAALFTIVLPLTSGYILSKKAVEERGGGIQQQPIGTGPYQYESFKPQETLTVVRFEGYGGAWYDHAERYQWDSIEFINATTAGNPTGELAMQAGEIDVLPPNALADLRLVKRFVDRGAEFNTTLIDGGGVYVLSMNTKNPNLRDKRVRQAIANAIDYDAMLQIFGEGLIENRAYSAIPPSMIGHWPDAPRDEYDPEAARALLAEAGVSSVDVGDVPVEPGAEFPLEAFQAMLRESGINFSLNTGDALRNDLAYRSDPDRYTFALGPWGGQQPDPSATIGPWATDQTDEVACGGYCYNFAFIDREDFRQLIAQGQREYDPDKRTQIYIDAQEILREELGHVYFAYTKQALVTRPDLQGVMRFDGYTWSPKDSRSI